MKLPTPSASSPIGLDLGTHSIKAAQFDSSGRLSASAHIPRDVPGAPYEAADIARLRGVLYRQGFRGTRIVLGAPKPIIQRLTIDLPPLDSGAPIDQIAQSELCRQRSLMPGSFEFRWHESPQPPRHASGARAVTETCTHEASNALLDAFEAQGLDPIALHGASTAYTAIATAYASGTGFGGTTAVVDLGWADTTMLTVRGGKIRFIRAVSSAGLGALVGSESWLAESLGDAIRETITDRDSAPLDEPDFDTLLKRYRTTVSAEIGSSVEYLDGCGPDEAPGTLIVLGGGAAVPGMREELVRVVQRGKRVKLGPAGITDGIASALATAGANAGDLTNWQPSSDTPEHLVTPQHNDTADQELSDRNVTDEPGEAAA